MESVLGPYDLGPTQWYVLYLLANEGPTRQRELGRVLKIERATMTGIVGRLVGKGLVEQTPDPADQRQRVLQITASGQTLWEELPDPLALIRRVAFDRVADADLAAAARVLEAATQRLNHYLSKGNKS